MLKQHIEPKLTVPEEELADLCKYFEVGKLMKFFRIKQGNINTNYYVRTSHGEYVMRFYTFKQPEEIEAEHEILDYLYNKGFPTPRPVEKGDKTYDFYKDKPVCCFSYVQGHHLKKIKTTNIKEVARVTAKLHNLTEGFETKKKLEGEGLEVVKETVKKKRNLMVKSDFKDAERFMNFLERELEKIHFPDNLPRGVVHVDIKNENTLFNHKFETLLDFDNCYFDSFIIDIGSSIMWWCTDKNRINAKKAKLFLKEYGKHMLLSEEELAYLLESLKFNMLKQAFKYAYIMLPHREFAEKKAYEFKRLYEHTQELENFLIRKHY